MQTETGGAVFLLGAALAAPDRPAGVGGDRRDGRPGPDLPGLQRRSLVPERLGRRDVDDLAGYAEELGLDVDRFKDDLHRHVHAERVAEDVEGADMSTVSGTPTFFVNGQRHYGAYDIGTLSTAVRAARARTLLPSRAGSSATGTG